MICAMIVRLILEKSTLAVSIVGFDHVLDACCHFDVIRQLRGEHREDKLRLSMYLLLRKNMQFRPLRLGWNV